MLTLNGASFTTGRARFEDREPGSQESSAKIVVQVRLRDLPVSFHAQVDTGAEWSLLDVETAKELDLLDTPGDPIRYSTRLGTIDGHLVRELVTIIAEEGESLEIEATFCVSADWHGKIFLGYSGFLERIRMALDPQGNKIYFGPAE